MLKLTTETIEVPQTGLEQMGLDDSSNLVKAYSRLDNIRSESDPRDDFDVLVDQVRKETKKLSPYLAVTLAVLRGYALGVTRTRKVADENETRLKKYIDKLEKKIHSLENGKK